jgi:CBS-domain-containing membrane protein
MNDPTGSRSSGAGGRRAPGGVGAVLLAFGAVIVGLLAGLGVHHGCTNPPPPVVTPDPGTPRAQLCEVVDVSQPWTQVVGTLVVALLVVTVLRSVRQRAVGLGLVVAVIVLLLVLALELSATTTI